MNLTEYKYITGKITQTQESGHYKDGKIKSTQDISSTTKK